MAERWLQIRGGRVIDGTGRPPEQADVLVKNNRVVAVGNDSLGGEVPPPDRLQVIDAAGMTVMPGLIDVHCHMTYGEGRTEEEIDLYTSHELRTLIAAANAEKVLRAGVTSISQPGGSYYIGVGVREGIKRGLVRGPRMTTAGRYLTTSNGLTDWYPELRRGTRGQHRRTDQHRRRDEDRDPQAGQERRRPDQDRRQPVRPVPGLHRRRAQVRGRSHPSAGQDDARSTPEAPPSWTRPSRRVSTGSCTATS